MYIDLLQLTNYLRLALATFVSVICIWSFIWLWAFLGNYRRRRANGPTVALIIKFGANTIFYSYLAIGFGYLASPYVTPLRSVLFLTYGCVGALGVIISYAALQWTYGRDDES